jgi:hypothetical protein
MSVETFGEAIYGASEIFVTKTSSDPGLFELVW